MTQKDRDRLVVLKKAQKKLIRQRQAADELQVSERHLRRMLVKLRTGGDRSVIHGLRGRPSSRKLSAEARRPCGFSRKRCTADLVPRWPASIWPPNTKFRLAGKPYGG